MSEIRPQYLALAKEGDFVLEVVSRGCHVNSPRYYYPRRVIKATAKTITIQHGQRFSRTGRPIQSGFLSSHLVDPTDDVISAYRAQKEELKQRREKDDREQMEWTMERSGRAGEAAKWLSEQSQETILEYVSESELNDIYERLNRE